MHIYVYSCLIASPGQSLEMPAWTENLFSYDVLFAYFMRLTMILQLFYLFVDIFRRMYVSLFSEDHMGGVMSFATRDYVIPFGGDNMTWKGQSISEHFD